MSRIGPNLFLAWRRDLAFFMYLLIQVSLQLCRKGAVLEEFMSAIFLMYFFLNAHWSSWLTKVAWGRKLSSLNRSILWSTNIRLWDFWSLKNCQCLLVDSNLHKICGRECIREKMCVLTTVCGCKPLQTTQETALRSRSTTRRTTVS